MQDFLRTKHIDIIKLDHIGSQVLPVLPPVSPVRLCTHANIKRHHIHFIIKMFSKNNIRRDQKGEQIK